MGALVLGSLLAGGCGSEVVVQRGSGSGGAVPTTTTTTSNVVTTTLTATTLTTTTTGTGGEGGFGGAPPIPALVETDLGYVTAGAPVEFDVPDGTISLTAVAHANWSQAEVYFDSLIAPSGALLVEDQYIPDTLYQYNWYGDVTLQVPQDDDPESMPLAPGLWQFIVGASGSQVKLSVWRRQTVDGLFHGGVIDFNVFLIAGVTTESYVESMLRDAFDGYAGLTAGTIRFFPLGDQWSVVDEYSLLPLFEETVVATRRPSINIMVVEGYSGWLEGAGGISMGIPGLPLAHGTYQSGMSMMLYGDSFFDGLVVRHEVGHLSGLFHTSEIEPGYGDVLADTPFCPDVDADPYACPDLDNLMFPYATGDQRDLTALQTTVIRASAMYRGRVEEGGQPAYPLLAPGMEPEVDDAQQVARGARDDWESARGGPSRPTERRPARADRAPWADRLPPNAARFLAGLWHPAAQGADPYALLERLGVSDPALLLEVARHPAAPPHVRMRATAAAGRMHPSPVLLDELVAIATDRGRDRFDRMGALQALGAAAPRRARQVAETLTGDSVRAVAAYARRIAW